MRPALAIILLLLASPFPCAAENYLFRAEITADNINVRTDSTVSSEVICQVQKGDVVEVVSSRYDWYKIRLPNQAPSYIRKDMVKILEDENAVVIKDKVNVRSKPDISSAILGKLNKGAQISVLEEAQDWYKIEPVNASFGWLNKNFASRIDEENTAPAQTPLVLTGLLRAKTFTRAATHKLIGDDGTVYLLKADKQTLDTHNRRRVKITGTVVDPTRIKYPLIEVKTIEALD